MKAIDSCDLAPTSDGFDPLRHCKSITANNKDIMDKETESGNDYSLEGTKIQYLKVESEARSKRDVDQTENHVIFRFLLK